MGDAFHWKVEKGCDASVSAEYVTLAFRLVVRLKYTVYNSLKYNIDDFYFTFYLINSLIYKTSIAFKTNIVCI